MIRAGRDDLTADEIDALKSLRGAVRVDASAAYASALGITRPRSTRRGRTARCANGSPP